MNALRPPDDLLARVLSGEGSPADRAVVERWRASSEAAARELVELRRAWGASPPPVGGWDVDAAWQRTSARLEPTAPAPDIAPVPGRRWSPWLQVAAAAVLVFGAAWSWRTFGPVPPQQLVYATTDGERRRVELADGSTVVLAPRSELVVPAQFGRSTREVTVTGEAWFSVVHDDTRTFTVVAGSFRVRDIGTVFTVRTHSGDTLGVSVVEGSVAVRRAADASADETLLAEGDMGRFTTGGVAAVVDRGQPTAALASWAAGDLALVDVGAGEAVAALTRWYGTPVRLADSAVADQMVTITLALDSLDRALDDLALLLGLTAERVGDGFVLR